MSNINNEVLDGNKIIAEFMGKKIVNNWVQLGDKYNGEYDISLLKYHSSWDWLMPACKKFNKLNLLDKEYERLCDEIDMAVSSYEVVPAFKNLVAAIKWYNQNKKL